MTAHRFDIGIIGAGPAGSSAANLLAARGYSVCLVDQCTFPRDKLCGDFLNPVNWPILDHLGVADRLLGLEHGVVHSFRISAATGETAVVPFPAEQGQPAYGLGISRRDFDHLLLNRAIECGVTAFQGSKTRGLQYNGDSWSIELTDPSGERTLQSRFLIGADGRNSRIARILGVPMAHHRGRRDVGFQFQLQGVENLDGEVQIHLFPGGYGGLVAIGGGTANLCLTLQTVQMTDSCSLEKTIIKRVSWNPRLKEALKGSRRIGAIHSVYPVRASRRKSFGPGFVLVGDAAYAPEPVTGEGVFFALKSGAIAARVIHQSFAKGDRSADQSARYETAWQRSLSRRQKINTVIRALVIYPSLLTPLVRMASKSSLPIHPLVHYVLRSDTQLE